MTPEPPDKGRNHLDFLGELKDEVRRRIWNEPADVLRRAIVSDYSYSLANAFRQDLPTIDFDAMTISYGEEDILIDSVNGEYRGWTGNKTLRRASVIRYHLPCTGLKELIKFVINATGAYQGQGKVYFPLAYMDGEESRISEMANNILDHLRRQHDTVVQDVKAYNSAITSLVEELVYERKTELLRQEEFAQSLGFPFEESGNFSGRFPETNDVEESSMNWSLNAYNLIVYSDTDAPIFRSQTGTSSFPVDRLFEHTNDNLKEKFQDNLAGLSELPTLVLGEVYNGQGTPAVFGRIYGVEKRGKEIRFGFERFSDQLTSELVFSCGYFDTDIRASGIDERRRTHWAVKQGNLIEGIFKLLKDSSDEQRPKLFNVDNWPMPILGHIAVMMPFSKEFDRVYDAIKSACETEGYRTLRVDEIYGPKPITSDIFSTIVQSKLVISDLSDRNPNVLYETGLAHALNRDVIMIVQNEDDIPFNVHHLRYLSYLPNGEGMEQLSKDLSASIQAVLRTLDT